MAPPANLTCQICSTNLSKYTCSSCRIVYCSVPCYKQHKSTSCSQTKAEAPSSEAMKTEPLEVNGAGLPAAIQTSQLSPTEPSPPSLRPLTSLRWPYIPEPPSYPDPLTRDQPAPLQLSQYEKIATSPDIRQILAANPRLPALLKNIDSLDGYERERTLENMLGVGRDRKGDSKSSDDPDDVKAMRALAEAVEKAVRREDYVPGLDWGDEL